jgi:hypothetical protein
MADKANNGSEGIDTLFSLTRRKRTLALAEMLDKNAMRNPATVRFALAGVVSAVDDSIIQAVARDVADYLRFRAQDMKD